MEDNLCHCKKKKNLATACNANEASNHSHSCCKNHKNSEASCCIKSSSGFLKSSTRLIISAISLVAGFCIGYFNIPLLYYPYSDPSWIAVILCSGEIFSSAYQSLVHQKRINAAMLVSVAMIASFGLQFINFLGFGLSDAHHESYIFVVGEIAFLMSLGSWLEDRTIRKSKESLKGLTNLMPKEAVLLKDGKYIKINASQIRAGDIICVKAGEMISADGVIVKGQSSVNESTMTGESIPVDKSVGSEVLCGTFNESNYIEIRATKASNQTTLSRLIELVKEAEGTKAPISRIANKWASYIVPFAIATSIAVYFIAYYLFAVGFAESITRAVTILVVFCPCAFVLATPTAISAGIGNASRNGILIKSGQALEGLAKITAVFFDKTGTLSEGKIEIDKFECYNDYSEKEVLQFAYAIEKKSSHPIAKAIESFAKSKISDSDILEASDIKVENSFQISGIIDGKFVLIRKSENGVEGKGASELLIDGKIAAIFIFKDKLRESAKKAIYLLKEATYKTEILSGDNSRSVERVANEIGFKKYHSNLMPQGKLDIIKQAQAEGQKVCMVGDGINDAPCLAQADVSIAIADLKSDIAINTAQIALLDANLIKVPMLLKFSKSVMNTIYANIIFSLTLNFAAILLGLFGFINPAVGALIHNASSVTVVINSARLLASKKLKCK